MQSMILFDNVRWQYTPTMGYYCDSKVGLVSMGDKTLGLQMRLKAQIHKRGNAQQMTFYIEAARDHWYFFRFDLMTQELTVYSSQGLFEDAVKSLSNDQRKVEKENLGVFRYHVGNNKSEVTNWLTSFSRTVYSDNEEEE